MSCSVYAAHLYGVEISSGDLLERFDDNDTILDGLTWGYDVNDDYPDYPTEAFNSLNVYEGPGSIYYVGYPATMPYESPRLSREEMNKHIYDVLVFLVGKEKADSIKPDTIFDAWAE